MPAPGSEPGIVQSGGGPAPELGPLEAPAAPPGPGRPVLIDTDPGIDDAVALALAARLATLRVVCITTVHGNTDVARATRNAREVAWRVGLRAPIVAGAARPLLRPPRPARETHGPEGLGYVRPSAPAVDEGDRATEAISEAADAHRGLALCCLGPLSNLARALRADAALPSRLGPVFIMGGTVGVRGTQTRWSEFNWWSDPEAVEVVLAAGLDIRLVPLDVTRRIAIPMQAIQTLMDTPDPDARFWAEALDFYARFHRGWERFDGCVVNDALAVALVADPALADWTEMRVGVALGDDEHRGALVADASGAARARVALGVRALDVIALISRHVFGRWVSEEELRHGVAAAERWLAENPQRDPRP